MPLQSDVRRVAVEKPKVPAVTPAAAAVVSKTTSLDVVHLHRLGNCRGRLDVTRDGVAFVSATDDADEAFALKYTDFRDKLSDDTLILRSAKRTYRFKAAASRSGGKNELHELAERIERARR